MRVIEILPKLASQMVEQIAQRVDHEGLHQRPVDPGPMVIFQRTSAFQLLPEPLEMKLTQQIALPHHLRFAFKAANITIQFAALLIIFVRLLLEAFRWLLHPS